MAILDSDYSTLTIIDNGKIKNRNLNEYNILKYGKFNGQRIIVKLSDKCEIVETFNEGIFNVYYGKLSMQIRDTLELCRRISFCIDNKVDDPIKELLAKNKKDELNLSYLQEFLSQYDKHIEFIDDKIVINKIFAVDKNGQAYFNDNGEFRRLCIVVGNIPALKMQVSDNDLGEHEIDFKTKEILMKVLFLLFPDITDSVFFNQLSNDIKKVIS